MSASEHTPEPGLTIAVLPPGGQPADPAAWRTARAFLTFDVPATYTDRAAATLEAVNLAASGMVHGVEVRDAASGATLANWHAGQGIWREWGRLDDRGWVDAARAQYAAEHCSECRTTFDVDPDVSLCGTCTRPCGRCRRPLHADEIDSASGLCDTCEDYNDARVTL